MPNNNTCRPFISIIFPEEKRIRKLQEESLVSILYKYHIPLAKNAEWTASNWSVSILYKYHIPLCRKHFKFRWKHRVDPL